MNFSEKIAEDVKRQLKDSRFQSLQANAAGKAGRVFYVLKTSATNYTQFVEDHPDYRSGDGVVTAAAVYNTVDAAIGACTADQGDVIYVMPGHTETFTAAAGFALDVAGASVIGLGVGNNRPVFTISSVDNAGTITQSGNNTAIKNIVVVTNDDGLTNAVVVTGDNCYTEFEHQDTSAAVEAATVVRGDTANNWTLRLKHNGFTAGNATVSAVRLDDCDNVDIVIDFYGIATTAVVEMVDVASTNVKVKGYFYVSGTTDLSKNVVDTISGSTWSVDGYDAAAGAPFNGGSGNAVAVGDLSVIASNLLVPTADVTTNTAARDVVGNKTDAAVTAVGTTKTILAYVKGLITMSTVQSADSTNNAFAGDVVGNKTDAAVTTVTTTKSLMAYIKGILNTEYALPQCVEKSDGAVLSGDDVLFNITGGPIHVLSITGIVTTTIGSGTTNVKLQIDTTTPAATIDINAGAVDIDGDAAGTSYETINTTGVFTPVTAGYVKHANSFATNPTDFLAPIGDIVFNSDAARTGNIKWYMVYRPLSPNSRVVAAA